MKRGPHVPARRCVGCGQSDAQSRLARFAVRDGGVAWDRERRLPGRGAYLHLEHECFDRFVRQKAFLRTLRRAVGSDERRRLVSEAKSRSAS